MRIGNNNLHPRAVLMAASAVGHLLMTFVVSYVCRLHAISTINAILFIQVFLVLCIMASLLVEAVSAASHLSGIIDNLHPQNDNMHPPQTALINRRWG